MCPGRQFKRKIRPHTYIEETHCRSPRAGSVAGTGKELARNKKEEEKHHFYLETQNRVRLRTKKKYQANKSEHKVPSR